MSWNADNTVWNPQGATNQPKLEHLGNGQWRFTSKSISEMVETSGGDQDDYPGKLTILWEPGVLREYFDENLDKQSGTYTFTGNGPASIRIGYSYPWNGGSGTPGRYTFTESTISNGRTDNRGNANAYGTSDENFGIDIPEVNPDNTSSSFSVSTHTFVARAMSETNQVLDTDITTFNITSQIEPEPEPEPEPFSPVKCFETTVHEPGSGFTRIQDIIALFGSYGYFSEGSSSYGTNIYFGSGDKPAGELDADGRLIRICGYSANIEYDEDNDGPSDASVYILQNPLELWVKSGGRWANGPGWGSNFDFSNPGPDWGNRIYANFTWTPGSTDTQQ